MPSPPDPTPQAEPEQAALLSALDTLLRPLARLALAKGLTCGTAETALRLAFVEAAREALADAGLPPHRMVSRISTSTGLNRREVSRLTQQPREAVQTAGGSLASEVFTRWRTQRAYQAKDGAPRVLQRQGRAPSFESLARSVTQDVHPRSLLEELCRLGMARLSPDGESVTLVRDAFVPGGDARQMLAFLADNVGDHLSGAVANVVGGPRRHFDQAVFADELSLEALAQVHAFVTQQWQKLLAESVPLLESLIEADRVAGRAQNQRLRIGLYAYEDDMASAAVSPPAPASQPDEAGDPGTAGNDTPARAAAPRRARRRSA